MIVINKISRNLMIFPLSFFLVSTATSEVTTTVNTNGSVEIYNRAESNVSGNGKVQMKITTDINGEKKEVESTKPGEIRVSIKDGQTETEIKTDASTEPNLLNSTPKPSVNPQNKKKDNVIIQFQEFISSFLSKLLEWFK